MMVFKAADFSGFFYEVRNHCTLACMEKVQDVCKGRPEGVAANSSLSYSKLCRYVFTGDLRKQKIDISSCRGIFINRKLVLR